MAKNERSLKNALSETPDCNSFLAGPDAEPTIKRAQSRKHKRQTNKSSLPKLEKKPPINAKVTISTRIQADTAQKLLETAYKRKISKKAPWSQQDITQAALEQWLSRNS